MDGMDLYISDDTIMNQKLSHNSASVLLASISCIECFSHV